MSVASVGDVIGDMAIGSVASVSNLLSTSVSEVSSFSVSSVGDGRHGVANEKSNSQGKSMGDVLSRISHFFFFSFPFPFLRDASFQLRVLSIRSCIRHVGETVRLPPIPWRRPV